MDEPRRLTVSLTVFTDEEAGSIGGRVAAALEEADIDIDYLAVAPLRETSDTELIVGHIRAAKWDGTLVEKAGLSQDRREIYLLNIQQHLEAALKLMGDD
jgi:hypothetical protein